MLNLCEIKAEDLKDFETLCELVHLWHKVYRVYPGEYTVYIIDPRHNVEELQKRFEAFQEMAKETNE